MICRSACIWAAGQSAPTNSLEPPLQIFIVVVFVSMWFPLTGAAHAELGGRGPHVRRGKNVTNEEFLMFLMFDLNRD